MKTLSFKLTTTAILFLFTFSTAMGQIIYTFAGTGVPGFGGDGTMATGAKLQEPNGVAVDATGNVYIVDYYNHRIRKVNTNGIISTFAGTGNAGFSGDGAVATNAQLSFPHGIAVDISGNVYISDFNNNRIRKVNTTGIISTFAGNGVGGSNGDAGLAINAQINSPEGIAVDTFGNVYIADGVNNKIRKVNASGIISTVAGTGVGGFSGDGSAATGAKLSGPVGVAFDASNNIYIADHDNNRIRKVNSLGIISTFAGTGTGGGNGDGGPANLAQVGAPYGVAVDASGNVYISTSGGTKIRKVNTMGVISTFAGLNFSGFSGDGGTPVNANFSGAQGIAFDALGNSYISDTNNNRVREICVSACLANVNSLTRPDNSISIFPNPNNGSFKIQIDNDVKNGKLILLNSIGQKIYEQEVIQGANEIKAIGLSNGFYNYILVENKLPVSKGKLTIE